MLIENFQLKAKNFLIGLFVGALSGAMSAGWPFPLINPGVVAFCAAFTYCIEGVVFVEYWKEKIVTQTLWISMEICIVWAVTAMFFMMAYILFGGERSHYAFILSGAFGAGFVAAALSLHVPHLREVRFYVVIALAGGIATSIGIYLGSAFVCSGRGELDFLCWLPPTTIVWQAIVLATLLACATREFDDENSPDGGSTPLHSHALED
ncbi:MAG: hypothetical protein WBO09_13305 [Methylocystis silviterrae]|uniref:hypothetical protein n=1 Tax=Methylocystis silviterrae TaxID=2743612 RepID=UPI003C74CD14